MSLRGCMTLPEATGSRCSMLGMYFRKCCLAKLGTFGKGVCRFRRVKENMPGNTNEEVVGTTLLMSPPSNQSLEMRYFSKLCSFPKRILEGSNRAVWATYYSINFLVTQVKHHVLINDMFQPFGLLKPSQPGLQTTSSYSSYLTGHKWIKANNFRTSSPRHSTALGVPETSNFCSSSSSPSFAGSTFEVFFFRKNL